MAHDIKLNKLSSSLKEFISALLSPMQTLTTSMKSFEEEYKKRARFNGQKIVLQAALNEIFGVTSDPKIIVQNTISSDSLDLYETVEGLSATFGEPSETPVYLFEPPSVEDPDHDFVVKIPSGIHTVELERRIKAETNLYKLAGKKFKTETY